jgi:hypothetical protein
VDSVSYDHIRHKIYSYVIFQLLLTNLTTDTIYTIEVRSASHSLYRPDALYKSPPSQPHSIRLGRNCDHVQPFTVLEIEKLQEEKLPSIDGAAVSTGSGGGKDVFVDLSTGVIAGVALVVMILMLVVVAIVLKRYVR